jgi:plastocyanin
VLVLACQGVRAAEVQISVSDADGAPLDDAVVALEPAREPAARGPAGAATMAQENQAFDPGVLAIRRGDRVSFPNHDKTQHHVYSFSPAKAFELPLYKGETPPPIEFDRAGVVTVGCNIHDHMRGFIYVADTPYFASTDADGLVRLDVPAGDYTVVLWHPRAEEAPATETVSIAADGLTLARRVAVKPPPQPPVKGLRAWVDK